MAPRQAALLGLLLTLLPWRRQWNAASRAVTLDNFSGGRAILSLDWARPTSASAKTGEIPDRGLRAEMRGQGTISTPRSAMSMRSKAFQRHAATRSTRAFPEDFTRAWRGDWL
jgi:hypothetical protein